MTVELTDSEMDYLLAVLQTRPLGEVYDLYNKMKKQAQSANREASPIRKPEAVKTGP